MDKSPGVRRQRFFLWVNNEQRDAIIGLQAVQLIVQSTAMRSV